MPTPFETRFNEALDGLIGGRPIEEHDIRHTALTTLTDLILGQARCSGGTLPPHFEEVMTALLPRAPLETRAEVSRRLAHSDIVPGSVVQMLADDVLAVAGPMLRQSPSLGADVLIAIAAGPSDEKAREIAGRTDLPREAIAALIDRGDAGIVSLLVACPTFRPNASEADRISRMTGLSSGTAGRLIATPGLADPTLARLFWFVDRSARRSALERLIRGSSAPDRGDDGGTSSDGPAAKRDRLLTMAAQGRRDEIVMRLAADLDISRMLARRIVEDPGGEALIVSARAAGASVEEITGLVLLTAAEPAASYEVLSGLVALAERLKPAAAAYFVSLWRHDETMPATLTAAQREPAIARPTAGRRLGSERTPRRTGESAPRIVAMPASPPKVS